MLLTATASHFNLYILLFVWPLLYFPFFCGSCLLPIRDALKRVPDNGGDNAHDPELRMDFLNGVYDSLSSMVSYDVSSAILIYNSFIRLVLIASA